MEVKLQPTKTFGGGIISRSKHVAYVKRNAAGGQTSRKKHWRRLVEGGGAWEASDPSQNWVGNEPKRTVTCMVLKATANDRRTI
ncbi:hypothetical protein TNCV_2328411 [Trichonephila clavipes]|nr:hypothetical protein TNCV_2328411 [Trichonephila clavipes]